MNGMFIFSDYKNVRHDRQGEKRGPGCGPGGELEGERDKERRYIGGECPDPLNESVPYAPSSMAGWRRRQGRCRSGRRIPPITGSPIPLGLSFAAQSRLRVTPAGCQTVFGDGRMLLRAHYERKNAVTNTLRTEECSDEHTTNGRMLLRAHYERRPARAFPKQPFIFTPIPKPQTLNPHSPQSQIPSPKSPFHPSPATHPTQSCSRHCESPYPGASGTRCLHLRSGRCRRRR